MKTALVGSSGYISEFILKRFADESGIDCVLKLDKDNESDVFLDLAEADKFDYSVLDNIDYVIFTAAVSSPDRCSVDFDACWNINVVGTSFFINEAIKRNCRVLFFSSDAVFGNIPGKIYDEDSETQAYTPYGKMKKIVEDKFKCYDNFKAIRLSYVASARDKFYMYLLNCLKNNITADVFHPFYRNVVVVSDVVDVVSYFAFNWAEYRPKYLNVAGRELVSRIRMADELNILVGGKLKYTVLTPSNEFFINRPMVTKMKSLYISRYCIFEDCSFSEKIAKELKEIKL